METYCNSDFVNLQDFKDEIFINQFIERITFFPFNINYVGAFAFTTADDLQILVSGLPMLQTGESLGLYLINRLLTLALLVIIILHEHVHYLKRLLYLLTCSMVSRITLNDNNERVEGGWIIEKLIFGWEKGEQKKINLNMAINLLNTKNYDNNVENF